MTERAYNVLFLSRRNSARSLMAEGILNKYGADRFRAFSAGVAPAAQVEQETLELLRQAGIATDGIAPKHYREFAESGAADLDFVLTLSDTAAGEALPEWPGQPVTAHWSSTDPLKLEGSEAWERKLAFGRAFAELERRLRIFVALPIGSLDCMSLHRWVHEIGQDRAPAAAS